MAENNRKSVPVYEQETHISYMRDEQFAKVYTSDTTQMTKFDKRCKDFLHSISPIYVFLVFFDKTIPLRGR